MLPLLEGVIYNGQVALGAAALLSNQTLRMVRFKVTGGTGYVGGSVALAAAGTGFRLADGEETGWIPCNNLNQFAASGTGTLYWMGHN